MSRVLSEIWIRLKPINVEDFGAVRNDRTKNKAAFEAALKVALAYDSFVFVPAGTWKV